MALLPVKWSEWQIVGETNAWQVLIPWSESDHNEYQRAQLVARTHFHMTRLISIHEIEATAELN